MEVASLVDAFCASLRGEREWRNIQAVLLDSFRSVGDILASQTRQLAAAERQIAMLSKRQQELESKSDIEPSAPASWQAIATETVRKAMGETLEELRRRNDKQIGEQVSTMVDERVNVLASELRIEVEQVTERIWISKGHEIESKLSQKLKSETKQLIEELATTMSSQVEPIGLQVAVVASRLQTLESRPLVQTPEFERRLEDLELEVEQGAGGVMLEKVEVELKRLDERLSTQLSSWRQESDRSFAAKVDKGELDKLLSRKMDALDGWKQLEDKASASQVDDVAGRLVDAIHAVQQATTRDVDELRGECGGKADVAELEQLKCGMHDLLAVAESMQSELSSVRVALRSHGRLPPATSSDEETGSIESSRFAAELETVAAQLEAVKRQLRGELYQARYVLNTNSEVFTWKLGSDRIRLLVPGLYHIQASFFTDFSPTVTVNVNGEPAMRLHALSLPPTPPAPASTSPPRAAGIAQRIRHSAGTVAGLTLDGVLALPSNALLSVSYDIHERAQGLLNIRKL